MQPILKRDDVPPSLADSLNSIIEERVKLLFTEHLKVDDSTASRVYQAIFNVFEEVLGNAKLKITNEAMNYVAQMYYDTIEYAPGQGFNPNIFTQRAKLENIPTSDILILVTVLKGSIFAVPLFHEFKRRQ